VKMWWKTFLISIANYSGERATKVSILVDKVTLTLISDVPSLTQL